MGSEQWRINMKTVYKCSICGKEYETKEGAVNCELSGRKEHSYEAGTVVRIKNKSDVFFIYCHNP